MRSHAMLASAFVSTLILSHAAAQSAESESDAVRRDKWGELGPGVHLIQESRPEIPLAISTLIVDTSRADIIMEPRFTDDALSGTRRPIHQIVARNDDPESIPFGAINADFGSARTRPPGPFVGQGTTWLLPHWVDRSSISVAEDGSIFIGAPRMAAFLRGPESAPPIELKAVNLQFRAEDWDTPSTDTLYTWPLGSQAPVPPEGFLAIQVQLDGEEVLPNAPAAGIITADPGKESLPLDAKRIAFHLAEPLPEWIKEGARVSVEITHSDLSGKVVGMVGGGPLILKDGEILRPNVQGPRENYGANIYAARHPRTAVGIREDGRTVVAMVVDGRQDGYSRGVNLVELAELMKEKGAYTAMNLDGGGSSTMVVQGEIVNSPSGNPRPLATAIFFRRVMLAGPANDAPSRLQEP